MSKKFFGHLVAMFLIAIPASVFAEGPVSLELHNKDGLAADDVTAFEFEKAGSQQMLELKELAKISEEAAYIAEGFSKAAPSLEFVGYQIRNRKDDLGKVLTGFAKTATDEKVLTRVNCTYNCGSFNNKLVPIVLVRADVLDPAGFLDLQVRIAATQNRHQQNKKALGRTFVYERVQRLPNRGLEKAIVLKKEYELFIAPSELDQKVSVR